MSGEHIVVDGYSILHQWKELDRVRQKNLAAGREALILLLTRFHDCRGGPLTVVFDGRSLPRGGEGIRTGIRVIYTREHQTADSVIERLVGQSAEPGRFLVATDDLAEQSIVESLGGRTLSADAFHAMVEDEVSGMGEILEQISMKNQRFKRGNR